MQPGDVFWIKYPDANGHEQSGRRPAIVLQDDAIASSSPLVLAIPLTTSAGVNRFSGTVFVAADSQNGLALDSLAMVFQLRATDRRRFQNKIGTVSRAIVAQIYKTLDQLTGHP